MLVNNGTVFASQTETSARLRLATVGNKRTTIFNATK